MGLALRLSISDPLLDYLLRLLDELAMEINRVASNTPRRIILPEDKVRGLLVVLIDQCAVTFSLFTQRMCCCAVTPRVCLVGLEGDVVSLEHFSTLMAEREPGEELVESRTIYLVKS
jgi:hypothetical protein